MNDPLGETKVCAMCHMELPRDCFYDHPRNKDGKQSYCADCTAAVAKVWQKKNRHGFDDPLSRGQRIKLARRQKQIARYGIDVVEALEGEPK